MYIENKGQWASGRSRLQRSEVKTDSDATSQHNDNRMLGTSPVVAQATVGTEEDLNHRLARKMTESRETMIEALKAFPVFNALMAFELKQARRDVNAVNLVHELHSVPLSSIPADTVIQTPSLEEIEDFPFTYEVLSRLCDQIVALYTAQQDSLSSVIIRPLRVLLKARHSGKVRIESKTKLSGIDLENNLINLLQCEATWLRYRNKLIVNNSGLVAYISSQYKGGFLDHEEIMQEGQIGLIKAVDRFDYTMGFQFSTYAFNWIRVSISRMIAKSERVVSLPFRRIATVNKVYRAREELERNLGATCSNAQLADFMGISIEEMELTLTLDQMALSLDVPVSDDGRQETYVNLLEQNIFEDSIQAIDRLELKSVLESAFRTLSSKEIQVICYRYGINCSREMTLQEIGKELDLTRERVRQIQAGAVKKIKQLYDRQLIAI